MFNNSNNDCQLKHDDIKGHISRVTSVHTQLASDSSSKRQNKNNKTSNREKLNKELIDLAMKYRAKKKPTKKSEILKRIENTLDKLEEDPSLSLFINDEINHGDQLKHYGVKGQKWGVIRSDAQLASAGKSSKQNQNANKQKEDKSNQNGNQSSINSSKNKKPMSEMSDKELRDKINRMEMETKYKKMTMTTKDKIIESGKKIIIDKATDLAKDAIMKQIAGMKDTSKKTNDERSSEKENEKTKENEKVKEKVKEKVEKIKVDIVDVPKNDTVNSFKNKVDNMEFENSYSTSLVVI